MGASGAPYVRILGKGRREREIPLWGVTQDRILAYHQKAMPHPRHKEHASSLFLSIRGQRLTRYQIGRIITTYIRKAAEEFPDMRKKRLHAHSIRHTTAVHLLMADVEVNTIKAWLGHASIETLQIYTALNVRKKREVLDKLITPAFLQCCQPSALDGSPGIPLLDLLHGL